MQEGRPDSAEHDSVAAFPVAAAFSTNDRLAVLTCEFRRQSEPGNPAPMISTRMLAC
jgi:hypothetical protein